VELDLANTRISDAGLPSLYGLQKLERLDLSDTAVTQAGVDAFKQAVPDCQVTWSAR
jgi:hypothetical protein